MNLKKHIIVIIFSLFIGNIIIAQQMPQFTQNMFTNMAVNPGYAGISGAMCVTGLVRQQWVGFKDSEGNKVAPETFLITFDTPVRMLHGGVGVSIIQDKIGFQKNVGLNVGYSYHRDLGRGVLGIGAQIIFLNKSVDASKYIAINMEDPIIKSLQSNGSSMLIDFALGLFYKVPDAYYIGISSYNLAQSKWKFENDFNFTLKRTFYFTAGYEFTLPNNPSFQIDPSIFIKTDGSSTQYDINALVKYNNKFWGGVTYRVQDAVAVILGMKYKNFRIGYAYDIPLSSIGMNGSHEILLGYCFKIEVDKARKRYKNTRFL